VRVEHKDLSVHCTYNLRHYGQVWFNMKFMGLIDRGRVAEFWPVYGSTVEPQRAVYFDMTSTRWDAYLGPSPN
jgi:hypothetical protein